MITNTHFLLAIYVLFADKNTVKFQLRIRLVNYEFSNNLMDATSSQYKNLKSKLEKSVRHKLMLLILFIFCFVSKFAMLLFIIILWTCMLFYWQ